MTSSMIAGIQRCQPTKLATKKNHPEIPEGPLSHARVCHRGKRHVLEQPEEDGQTSEQHVGK
jgi:hypothetical protein